MSRGKGRPAPRQTRFFWLADQDVTAAKRLLALLARGEHEVRAPRSATAAELEDCARAALALRERRVAMLGEMFSAEPPFAMMLALYATRARGTPQTATELNESAGVTPSTGLRWLDPMEAKGWIKRARGSDARTVQISLTQKANDALDQLFGAFL